MRNEAIFQSIHATIPSIFLPCAWDRYLEEKSISFLISLDKLVNKSSVSLVDVHSKSPDRVPQLDFLQKNGALKRLHDNPPLPKR